MFPYIYSSSTRSDGSIATRQSSNRNGMLGSHSQDVGCGNTIPKNLVGQGMCVPSVYMFVGTIRTKDSRLLCAIWVHAPTSIVVAVDGEIIKPCGVFCWGRMKYNSMSMFWK
jgi:hypothetical protein